VAPRGMDALDHQLAAERTLGAPAQVTKNLIVPGLPGGVGCVEGRFAKARLLVLDQRSCAVASDCPQNGLCVSETDFGWPHGYCVTSKCATSATVPRARVHGQRSDGVCALRCTGDTDCRTGYHCNPAGRAGENVCIPTAPATVSART